MKSLHKIDSCLIYAVAIFMTQHNSVKSIKEELNFYKDEPWFLDFWLGQSQFINPIRVSIPNSWIIFTYAFKNRADSFLGSLVRYEL
ncbi:hypothetical protein ABW21_db0207697 [Orbilia brochopaga]|nr:hypothetical protein ABW21_db0207697 [Drechslerella brochopaga]